MSVQGAQITVMLMLTVLILKVVYCVSVEQAIKEMVKVAQVNKHIDINNYVVNLSLNFISKLLIFLPPADINECLTDDDNCDVNADCTNTPGSFECMCRTGFEGSGIFCGGMQK